MLIIIIIAEQTNNMYHEKKNDFCNWFDRGNCPVSN